MEDQVYIFIADGFEEIEGLMVVDLLRRAGIPVTMVSIKEGKNITGSHGILLETDRTFGECSFSDAGVLVLPGGKAGTENLRAFAPLAQLLTEHFKKGKKVAAICAAPTVLSGLGILKGKKATCYPTLLDTLDCAEKCTDPVVTDGNVTTSRGLGTAIDFALSLIGQLRSAEKAEEIASQVVYIR